MADEDRSFAPTPVQANRAEARGLGVGQKELNAQRGADRNDIAVDPDRTEPFDRSLDPTTNADRPSQADFSSQEPGDGAETRSFQAPGSELDDRNAAGLTQAGDLGAGTPPGVDVHDLGQRDRPQEEWGHEDWSEEAVMHSADHTRRPIKTEAERGQGAKTRKATKDIISRRA